MADTMQFDLVSPERRLASLTVTEVQLPGAEGDMTAMANHEPLITTLRPGILTVTGPDGDAEFVVTGGFAQITAESTTVLAEQAMKRSDLKAADIDGFIAEAEKAVAAAKPETKDAADKALADMQALREHASV